MGTETYLWRDESQLYLQKSPRRVYIELVDGEDNARDELTTYCHKGLNEWQISIQKEYD